MPPDPELAFAGPILAVADVTLLFDQYDRVEALESHLLSESCENLYALPA